MTLEDLVRDALVEADRRPLPPPDVSALVRRLARHDRLVVVRRCAVAGAGLTAAVVAGLLAVGDARGETVDVRPAEAPVEAPATTTTTAAPTTTTAPPPTAATTTTAPPAPTPEPPAATPVTAAPAPSAAPPAAEPAPHEPAPPVGWSANAAWGSCDLDPPYDEYSGTAAPGTTVSVSSPYGSGTTTADADGHWYVKVEFPGAPLGETFAVTVSSAQGSATFDFTRTA